MERVAVAEWADGAESANYSNTVGLNEDFREGTIHHRLFDRTECKILED